MSVDGAGDPRWTRGARTCEECGQPYFARELFAENPEYFPPPYDYESGMNRYWLGVGPGDTARDDDDRDEIRPDEIG